MEEEKKNIYIYVQYVHTDLFSHITFHPRLRGMNKFHFMPGLNIYRGTKEKLCSITKDKFELIWVIFNKLNWN